jgi:hypothetical protein
MRLPDVTGSEAEYRKAIPRAMEVSAARVTTFRGDPTVLYHNVAFGVDEVARAAGRQQGMVSAAQLGEFDEMKGLALALAFAVRQANPEVRSDGILARKISRAAFLRKVLLDALDLCAFAGIIQADDGLKGIHRGHGPIDAAQDCLDCAAKFRANAAALAGKTPVDPAWINEAESLGTELVTVLKKATVVDRSPSQAAGAVPDPAEIRDRIFALLHDGHEQLWKAGASLFGKAVEAHVPPLLSAHHRRATAPTESAPSGTPTLSGTTP